MKKNAKYGDLTLSLKEREKRNNAYDSLCILLKKGSGVISFILPFHTPKQI